MQIQEVHPLVSSWFLETVGEPTPVQNGTWGALFNAATSRRDVLALAPTGSGKTFAAFLLALSRFLDGSWPCEGLKVLYISPLKALNEDIRRNLLSPIESLSSWCRTQGVSFPRIAVETRSGDTPAAQRRRFHTQTPQILATTPESLAILLNTQKGRAALASVELLVIDEVHALLGTKRGAFLSCQIARLRETIASKAGACDTGRLPASSLSTIALSATLAEPLAAAFFCGFEDDDWTLVNPVMEKRRSWRVEYEDLDIAISGAPGGPGRKDQSIGDSPRWKAVASRIISLLEPGKTLLVFSDSRRQCERIAHLINTERGAGTAWAHHGSLSKELRLSVERRLKAGELACVVATASLELGIDIGELDQVVLVGTPPSVSQALQRMGRSGHRVSQESRCIILPLHGIDLLLAAALSQELARGSLEPLRPIERPLDILAQAMMSLVLERPASPDELWERLSVWPPFRSLERGLFDATLSLLLGWRDDIPLRSLRARLRRDSISGLIHPSDGLAFLLHTAGGAITSRGLYALRLSDGPRIGELDEEFVWERRAGDSFTFGNRPWRIQRIDSESVEVVPHGVASTYMPFWRADERYRSGLLFTAALRILEDPGLLEADDSLSPHAREALHVFIRSQTQVQGGLPPASARALVLEVVKESDGSSELSPIFLHTMRGGAVNQLLALALQAALDRLDIDGVGCFSADSGILILIPSTSDSGFVYRALELLYEPKTRRALLFDRIESSGIFGAAFREAAERSLVLPRPPAGKRLPLWIMRQRSRKLFEAVRGFRDFPLTSEAWRVCLEDSWDFEGFNTLLDSLAAGTIRLDTVHTRMPSPFSRSLVWKETNALLYEDDETPGRTGMSLDERIVEDVLSSRLPPLSRELVDDFNQRLKRLDSERCPRDRLDLDAWLYERALMPAGEWEALKAVLPEGLKAELTADPGLGGRLVSIPLSGSRETVIDGLIVHHERLDAYRADPLSLLPSLLRFEGPCTTAYLASLLDQGEDSVSQALEALVEEGLVIPSVPLSPGGSAFCDRENLERILRLGRSLRRPCVKEKPPAILSLLAASKAGIPSLSHPSSVSQGAQAQSSIAKIAPWSSLSLWQAPSSLFERELFPARDPAYVPSRLDRALGLGELVWRGAPGKELLFCPPDSLDLASLPMGPDDDPQATGPIDWGDRLLDFWQIRDALGLGNREAAAFLWEEVFRGRLSADSFEAVRRALSEGFDWPHEAPGDSAPMRGRERRRRTVPRALAQRFRNGAPIPGKWFSLAGEEGLCEEDPLDREELDRERVRLLLSRYGILARPLLEKELPVLGWSALLPTLRRMELSGELVSGRFVSGLNSQQFALPQIVQELEALEEVERRGELWWVNACDPVSMAGLSIEGLDPRLPPRLAGTRLCFKGSRLVALSRKNGKEIEFYTDSFRADAPALAAFAAGPARRAWQCEKPLAVTSIDGAPALRSPWAAVLIEYGGFEQDRQRLVIW